MLVVRRRPGESVLIGDSIEVQVLEVSGGQVKIGLIAPREVTIIRSEVLSTVKQNNVAVVAPADAIAAALLLLNGSHAPAFRQKALREKA